MKPDQSIKPQLMLIADLLGAYLGVCSLHPSHADFTLEVAVCGANHVLQPIHFLSLFIIYKFVYGTRFRSVSDFEDAYFLPNFDEEPLAKRPHGFKAWIKEIWSFAK